MKNVRKRMLFIAMLIGIFALGGCGKKDRTINLNKYISIETKGYNTAGTAKAKFDKTSFIRDYENVIYISEQDKKYLSEEYNIRGLSDVEIFLEVCVDYGLNKQRELSNGDKIKFNWDIDEKKAAEIFNIYLVYADIDHAISGLEKVGEFNPFDYITVTFDGIEPDGRLTITTDEKRIEMKDVYVTADYYDGLKEGDVVKVTASYYGNGESLFIENYGSKISKTEETYVVEGLDRYAKDVSDISDDLMSKMISQGEDAFRSYVANVWDKPENLVSVSLTGNYFLTAKPNANVSDKNCLYLIYEIKAINPDPEEEIDFYYYVCFNDIMVLADGTCTVDLSDYDVPESDWGNSESFEVGRYTYTGYENLDTLFNKCVVTKIESYEYTSSF